LITRMLRSLLYPLVRRVRRTFSATPPFNPAVHPKMVRAANYTRIAVIIGFSALLIYALAEGMIALVRELLEPWPAVARSIPAAAGCSVLRLSAAYLISLMWTVPCAIAASESQRFARRLTPIAQIIGSIPATALFPLIVVFVIQITGGMNLASILLILTGMQWYLLFNLLAGVSQIPSDLKEAARAFGLSRLATWRKLTIPAMIPSLLTGSITAWGGGWNALILSEYFIYRGRTYQVFGLGALLDDATYQAGSGVMILLTLLSMVLVVMLLNRLVWRRFYDLATERYTIDY
jgi:NitT/TauT family transport system permease protein